MFELLKQRFRSMSTIKALCLGAIKYAKADGQKEPGAEHFVLMALELPDGTARNVFKRVSADPDDFREAIARQYSEALQHIGVIVPPDALVNDKNGPFPNGASSRVQPSAQALINEMIYTIKVKEDKMYPSAPLIGAHVILAATYAQYGVTVRAFRAMGIDPEKLSEAAKEEIAANRMA